MKYFITFIFAAGVIFYSCGDDNTTNNSGTGGETVIFSMDSLSIYLTSNLEAKDTNIVINNSQNIKLTFNCTTNADSISTLAMYRVIAFDSTNFFIDTLNNHHSSLNNLHTINIVGSNLFFLKLYIQMSRGDTTNGFIKLSNIKIVKP